MSSRTVERYVCDQCLPDEVEATPIEVLGVRFDVCTKQAHRKPVETFRELAKKFGHAATPSDGRRQRADESSAQALVSCPLCRGSAIKKSTRYSHARNVHGVGTRDIDWKSASK